jgi:hypothetical protein
MEDVLSVYEEPYDESRPVICFDEKPCQIISDTREPKKAEKGKPEKYDYEYKRQGVCSVFVAVEPLKGKRMVEVRNRRTKLDYAHFFEQLASKYKKAEVIKIVQDNLNTHSSGSFYEAFRASKALELKMKFEFHFTPKHASWLNMAEVEISSLTKMCLARRFDDQAMLALELKTLVRERNRNKAKLNWTFTIEKARLAFKRHYHS